MKKLTKKEKINILLRKANDRLRTAILTKKEGYYEDSINRSYYAIFTAARAALILKDVEPKTHTGVKSKFGLCFIKTGIFDKKYSDYIVATEDLRLDADYEFIPSFTKKDAEDSIKLAFEFVNKVSKYIEKEF